MSVRLRGIRVAILCFAVLILGNVLAADAVEVTVLSAPQEEAPGAFITHVFSVFNDTEASHDYLVEYVLPDDWSTISAPTRVTLAPDEESTFFATITIAPTTPAGVYDVTMTAAAEDEPSDAASAAAPVTVTPVSDFELVLPEGGSASPGGRIRYEILVVNRGNAQDSYALDVSSSNGYPLTVSAGTFALAPQERRTIEIQLAVPEQAGSGRDAIAVVLHSTLYEDLERDGVIFTTILPPGPESVSGMLMEVLPARIRLSLDKDVLDGDFSSRLTFSTSGQIRGGYFSANLSATDPLGEDKPELGSFSILYRREPTTYSLGDVSQTVTDLIRLSCLGGSVIVDEEWFDLRFVGGGRDDETRFAGYLGLGPERANAGFAYYGVRDTALDYASIWSGVAFAEPFEDWTIRIEGALGIDNGLTSRAFFFGTTIDVAGYFLNAAAFSVGTFFPGSRADSAGIEISQRLRMSALSLSVSLEHVWDNVIADPLVPTEIQDEMGLNLRATPIEDGPTFALTAEFEWDRYDDATLMSEVDTLLSAEITETSGVFPYAISGRIADEIDHVSATHIRTSRFIQGAGLSTDSLYVFLELEQEKTEDVVAQSVLSSSSDISIRFRPEGALHEASITYGSSADSFDLSASLDIEFLEDLDITFDGDISWNRIDSSDVSFGWGITLSANVGIPMPFFVTKGQIEGRVFIDRDLDGRYSLADEPAADIIVAADRTEVSTNEEGIFRLPPLYPETYTIVVSELPLNAAAPEPFDLLLECGDTLRIDIPLTPIVVVSGRVFEDINQDGIPTADEPGYARVLAVLRDESGTTYERVTDLSGGFIFRDVAPGRYTLSVSSSSLPDLFEFTTLSEIPLEVADEDVSSLAIGGFVRPREVIVTFQPPTADFEVSPARPVAGEPVRLDGTLSFDFDGAIIAYVWDLDGDGNTDATSAVVDHTFFAAGTYEVSLTVIDDAGNSDTLTIELEVGGRTSAATSTLYPPIADFSYAPVDPSVGEAVTFDGTLSTDLDGTIAAYSWDFDEDGQVDATTAIATYTFTTAGPYSVSLTVTDNTGNRDTMTYTIQIGGTDSPITEPAEDASQDSQPPAAAFVYTPAQPLAGDSVRFNGTASLDADGRIVAFAWDFDDDGAPDSTEAVAERTFTDAGAYPVTLAVVDNDGNSNSITKTVVIEAPLPEPATDLYPPIAKFGYSPAEPEVGFPVLFNASASTDLDGTIVSYEWDFDADLQADASGPIAEYSFSEGGTHPVSLTVTDDAGNRDTHTLSVTVTGGETATPDVPLEPPVADYTYQPASPEPGTPIDFDGSLSEDPDGTIVAYTWSFAGVVQTPSTSPLLQYAFPNEGTYSVSLTVRDDSGLSDTATYLINVGEAPPEIPAPPTTFQPPVADFSYMPASPLAGELVLFDGTLAFDFDGAIVSYAWDFNADGTTDSTDPRAEWIFPAPGVYDVSLTVTDDSSIRDTITYPISIE